MIIKAWHLPCAFVGNYTPSCRLFVTCSISPVHPEVLLHFTGSGSLINLATLCLATKCIHIVFYRLIAAATVGIGVMTIKNARKV